MSSCLRGFALVFFLPSCLRLVKWQSETQRHEKGEAKLRQSKSENAKVIFAFSLLILVLSLDFFVFPCLRAFVISRWLFFFFAFVSSPRKMAKRKHEGTKKGEVKLRQSKSENAKVIFAF